MIAMLSHMQMLHPMLAGTHECFDTIPERVKFVGIERSIDATPIDSILARMFFNDESICG